MNGKWFVAKRLYSEKDTSVKVSRPAMVIATAGIVVGVAIMILSVCVVKGFQSEIRNKLYGVGGHIQVLAYESLGSELYQPIVVDSAMMDKLRDAPYVRHVQRFCTKPGMLKTQDTFRGVAFRGVGADYDTSFLKGHLVEGEVPSFSDTVSTGRLLVSATLARQLSLGVGDNVYAYYFEKTIKARKFSIAGIYNTSLTDFDKQLVFCDFYTVRKLLGLDTFQCSGAEVVLSSYSHIDSAMDYMVRNVSKTQDAYGSYYTVMSIQDLYPTIFAWLQLLDMDVWAILILMVCVSGFTIVSGLLIVIMERTGFIGVMKAMGASDSAVRRIFLNFSSLMVLKGIVWGNVVAFALLLLQKHCSVVSLNPEVYYMSAMPVDVNIPYILSIDTVTLVVSVLSLLVPSAVISHIRPVDSIRFE